MKLQGRIVQTTDWAVLLHHGARRIWLPKQWRGKYLQMQRPGRLGLYACGPAVVAVPRSLARIKGLG